MTEPLIFDMTILLAPDEPLPMIKRGPFSMPMGGPFSTPIDTPMLAHLLQNDIKKWAKSYLSALAGGPPKQSLLGGIRSLFKTQSDPTLSAFRRATNRSTQQTAA